MSPRIEGHSNSTTQVVLFVVNEIEVTTIWYCDLITVYGRAVAKPGSVEASQLFLYPWTHR